ncbi:50S ribosomal protein L15 [Campylobacter troglodytis]|uniref:50S ribosomal protein L15 n=1 Tax=Campylobacter troglodytis TaxID=654363 RepID=UPI00249F632C|nr:50S ribosomal protein L15 [Campylobacter troglodytis]
MNLTKAPNSTHKTKRIGRGQGSGMGKTATKGGKGQTARKGYNEKRGFEGGQQPLQRRLPKVGFSSKITKPYAINVEKIRGIKDLAEISFESLKDVHKFAKSVTKIKLIGKGAKELASKIKDERISTSGQENSKNSAKVATKKSEKVAKAENSSPNSAKSAKNSADEKAASVKAEKVGEKPVNSASEKAENSVKPTSSKAQNSTKAEKVSSKTASKAENSAKNSATKASGEKASKKATNSAPKTETKSTKKESEAK